MARFNEILVGRYNRFLQKFLSMKGGPPAPQLASEIAATFALFHGQENRILEAWNIFGVAANVAAAAGFTSGVRLRNPVGSNVIAVVTALRISETQADAPFSANGGATADLATVLGTANANFDSRLGPPTATSSVCILSRQNTAAAVPALTNQNTFDALRVQANVPRDLIFFEDQEITILPGSAIQIIAGAVNFDLEVAIMFRERALEDSERNV